MFVNHRHLCTLMLFFIPYFGCNSSAPKPTPRLSIALVSPSANFHTNGSIDISISIAAPDEAPTKVELLSNGTVVSKIPDSNRITLNTMDFPEGSYELTARATHPKIVAISSPITMVVDRSAPSLESRQPESAHGLASDATIWLHFSEILQLPSNPTTAISLTNAQGAPISAAISLVNNGKTVSITPQSPLVAETQIQLATTAALTDLAGNPAPELAESFDVKTWGATGPALASNQPLGRVILKNGPNGNLRVGWLKIIARQATIQATFIISDWLEGTFKHAATALGTEMLSEDSLQMALNSSATPTVMWQSPTQIEVKRWNVNQWDDLSGIPFSSDYSSFSLTHNANQDPVIALVEPGACGQLKIFEWAAGQWNSVPSPTTECVVGQAAISGDDDGLSALVQIQSGVYAYRKTTDWTVLGNSTVHPPILRHATHPAISKVDKIHAPNVRLGDDGVFRVIYANAGKITAFEFINDKWIPMGLGELNLRQEEAFAEAISLKVDTNGHGFGLFTDLTPPGLSPASTKTYFRFKTTDDWTFSAPLPAGIYLDGLITTTGSLIAAVLTPQNTLELKRYNPTAPIQYPQAPSFGNSICGPFTGDPDDVGSEFPKTLSDTNCYSSLANRTPTDGAIPYAPSSTLWTDASVKRRYVFLPTPESQIEYRDLDSWVFPVGTIIMKEFLIHSDMEDPRSALIPMETRFLIRENDTEWKGYSYQWNEEGSDATLRSADEGTVTWTVANSPGDNENTHEHFYPSRAQCFQCHDGIDADKVALGLKTNLLNSWYWQQSGTENQLSYMNRHNLIANFPNSPALLPSGIPSPYNSAHPLETRVKSYLHGNCSHCHNSAPGTCGDHRFATSLTDSEICNHVDAGNPAGSTLYSRSLNLEFGMPPIGRLRVDPQLTELFSAWISTIDSCE